jgi:dTDP-4-amino-4,6-dideoxygalactose transaminase
MRVPLLVPRMPTADRLLPYLQRIDDGRWYTNFGPLNAEFERRIVALVAPHMSALNIATTVNCTIGLELALQALQLRPHARVLIPDISFVATATAVRRSGMIPVLAEVDETTWCLTPALADSALGHGSVDAVMPVATFGCPQDAEQWDEFSARTRLPVVIDAAGAFGNQTVGKLTDVAFSFHATKSLGAAEGGAVLSSSEQRIAYVRRLSNFGIDISTGELRDIGTNGKMSEYHCAVGLASLEQWEETKRDRVALWRRYSDELRDRCPDLSHQQKPREGVYSVMTVLVPPSNSASSIARELSLSGVETRRWYCPALHRHPALADSPRTKSLDVADDIGSRLLGLPFFLGMRDEQIGYVCDRLAEALSHTA